MRTRQQRSRAPIATPPESPWSRFRPHRYELPRAGILIFFLALLLAVLFGVVAGGFYGFAYTLEMPGVIVGAVLGVIAGVCYVCYYWNNNDGKI